MSRIAIVGAFAMEAEIVCRRHEESLQDVSFGDVVDFRCHVEHSAHDGHRATETQYPVMSSQLIVAMFCF